MHVVDATFIDSVKHLDWVTQEAEQFCWEVSPEEFDRVPLLYNTEIEKYGILPDNKTLKDIYTPKQWDRINVATKRIIGKNLADDPEMLQSVGRFVPIMYINSLEQAKKMQSTADAKEFVSIDMALINYGKMLGKEVLGLEKPEAQIKCILPLNTSLEEQKKYLLYYLDKWEDVVLLKEQLKKSYCAQDVKAISKIVADKNNPILCYTKELHEKMFAERNMAWVKQMPEMMKQKSTFFFVGAGHLFGKQGVLKLLRKQGYTVEPMQ
jgi:uncharacterized protein YbaP (TraB family)